MKPLFRRDWEPDGPPRAVVALVHGLGEHSGRYERLAARFTGAGIAVSAIDLRGHGKSPGARGDIRFAPAVDDIDALVRACGERGVPVFVYGHSLGALLAVLWLMERPSSTPVAGVVVSAIGLHSSLREQAAKVRAARVLGRWVPKVRVRSGIDPATISRDPEVVRAYRADKLVHDTVSLGFGLDALETVDAVVAGAPGLTVPAARAPRQRGHDRLRVGLARVRRARAGRVARSTSTTRSSTRSTRSPSRSASSRTCSRGSTRAWLALDPPASSRCVPRRRRGLSPASAAAGSMPGRLRGRVQPRWKNAPSPARDPLGERDELRRGDVAARVLAHPRLQQREESPSPIRSRRACSVIAPRL